jgi:hypothetical protein
MRKMRRGSKLKMAFKHKSFEYKIKYIELYRLKNRNKASD